MSSRVLRKLQGDKEKELIENENLSDLDVEVAVIGGARKKQLNINRYDLLNHQSHSESEVKEDDNETEAPKSCEGNVVHELGKKKRKKRKKKSGKQQNHKSSEDNADIDEIERSLREVNRLLGDNSNFTVDGESKKVPQRAVHRKTTLSVHPKHLNSNTEIRRMFGSKIIQNEHKRKSRGASRAHLKSTLLVTCRENWRQTGKSGLSMALIETKEGIQYFTYEHSQNYRQVENRFLQAVESFNPDNIVAIINDHPYHVNTFIQMSDLCKLSEDLAMAAELIERALYNLEYAFHPLFNVAQGNCRLDYRRQENRALYVTIFKHLMFLGSRACCRTSLEFGKLLLSLDPDGDPLAIKLALDFYALRAREYQWLISFVEEFDDLYHLNQLPNFAFSLAIANFYLGDPAKADSHLQDALIMFPFILLPLLDKCSIQIDQRVAQHKFFVDATDKTAPASLNPLISLYVNRNYHIWKDADLLPWLKKNVHEVLDRVDQNDEIIEESRKTLVRRFSGTMPLSIARHIILSEDVKGIIPVTESFDAIMSFDPLPPKDSINLYTRPKRPTVANSSSNPFLMFLGSIMPDFNPNQPAALPNEEGEQAQALERPETGNEFRGRIATLVDAINDLLSGIRPEVQQQQQQQSDADDDADSGDDENDDDLT